MSANSTNRRSPWRSRAIVLAGVVAISVAGVTPAAMGREGNASAMRCVLQARIGIRPTSGPWGTEISVKGIGFCTIPQCAVEISLTDALGTYTFLGFAPGQYIFLVQEVIPSGAAVGPGTVLAHQNTIYDPGTHRCKPPSNNASATFTVTPSSRAGQVR